MEKTEIIIETLPYGYGQIFWLPCNYLEWIVLASVQ